MRFDAKAALFDANPGAECVVNRQVRKIEGGYMVTKIAGNIGEMATPCPEI